ncbi:hypothetical protein ZWY2020_000089 [Hordeum vulgare]|nr:hypothetical protein ZWY2020_000089 [Hordeum vulgare]
MVSRAASPPAQGGENEKEGVADAAMNQGPAVADADAEQVAQIKEEEAVVLSKKQKRQLRRMNIAMLKQMCSRPDVVEVWDGNAPDPKLLVCLKSCRNTVPVLRHWCEKRKYLQGKRGLQKQPFQLPDFIAAYVEKENNKALKQKQHGRILPKTGNLDMDYQVLHDAFFKYQTKPTLTSYGDLYYEGKEFQVHTIHDSIYGSDGALPPWVTRMQFFGPPPFYPYLKIPGFNAPISPGDSLGDVPDEGEPIDRNKYWGELNEEEEEEEDLEDGATLANFAGPAHTAINGALSPSLSKRRSNRSALLPPHSLILSLSLFLLLSSSHRRHQRHCCRLKLKMSFCKEEESSDEDICMVSMDQQLFEIPDTMVDPSFYGSFLESEPTCMMHHQRPKKMVAFEGSLTGRRFLGYLVQQV